MMKKAAHIFIPHMFAKMGAPFFKNNFEEYKFDVFILRKIGGYHNQPEIEGITYLDFNSFREELSVIQKIFDEHDYVYIHSMFLSPQIKLALMLTRPDCVKKLVWIEWGYDLYPFSSSSVREKIKNTIKRFVQLIFDRKVGNFVAIHPIDVDVYKKRINGKANINVVQYRFNHCQDPFLVNFKKVSLKDKNGKPLVIQVNHRADSDFHHIEILDKLKTYKDYNIQILLPLSYGDTKYGDFVEQYAQNIFGKEKVVGLRSLVNINEYRKILSSVDVFVIYANRQVALGNIHTMFYMQKKVYMPKDSLMSSYFKKQGIKIFDMEDLGQITYNDLCKDDDLYSGREYMLKNYAEDSVYMWNTLFTKIQK